ncbi:unnamed protein product [Rangifer tarandus platyrhynchus]|uniref:Uncharacterized protein n=2 Tax=Rangifer tarandus platyrhynchus TaxID=3082113 RepID=A0AC59Z6N9_RANTA|nr:unnamed protein product [Rangifer tarandus platyrhynchus]
MPSMCLTSNTGAFLLARLHPKQPPGLADSALPRAPARWPESLLHSAPSRYGWKGLHAGGGLQQRPPAPPPAPGPGKHVWLAALVERRGVGEGVETGERGRTQPAPLEAAPRDSCTEATLGWPLGSSPPAQVQPTLGHAVKEGLKWAEGPWRVPSGHFTAAVPQGLLRIHHWGVPAPEGLGPVPLQCPGGSWLGSHCPPLEEPGHPESGRMTRNGRCRPHNASLRLGTCCSNCRTGRIKT